MAKVIIRRKKSFICAAQNHDVYLHNTYVGNLKNGGVLEFQVEVGVYSLCFKSNIKQFGQSTEFTIKINEDDEVVELETSFMADKYIVEYADNGLNFIHGCNQTKGLRKKDKIHKGLIVCLCCIAIISVLGVIFIISPWGDGVENELSQNDILSRYEKAEEAFNKCELRQMQQILAQLQQLYPEEEANIEQFMADKIQSLPHINAGFLMNEYNNNRVDAEFKYSNKLIIVQGEVISIGKDILDTTYIVLEDVATDYSILGVKCEFVYEEEIVQVAMLKKGDFVTVLGQYEDSILEPVLKKCYIIDSK